MYSRLMRVALGTAICLGSTWSAAQAQRALGTFSLKSGESVEVGNVFHQFHCRSDLTGPMQVSILEGPPAVTAEIVDAMVTPRVAECANPIKGGKLKLSAGTIEDVSDTVLTMRLKFPTKDGERQETLRVNMTLFP